MTVFVVFYTKITSFNKIGFLYDKMSAKGVVYNEKRKKDFKIIKKWN
jgi:hypothetical protein